MYIDECGFNVWTRRTRGRAVVGQPAVRRVRGQCGRSITIVLGISEDLGVVHWQVFEGGMTREIFSGFLSEISALIGEENPCSLIFDNARSHQNVQDPAPGHECVFLPPYSPQLNPIELAFSTIKAEIKRQLSVRQDEFAIIPAGLNAAENRRNNLQVLSNETIQNENVINQQRIVNWCNHSRRFIVPCIAEEDFNE